MPLGVPGKSEHATGGIGQGASVKVRFCEILWAQVSLKQAMPTPGGIPPAAPGVPSGPPAPAAIPPAAPGMPSMPQGPRQQRSVASASVWRDSMLSQEIQRASTWSKDSSQRSSIQVSCWVIPEANEEVLGVTWSGCTLSIPACMVRRFRGLPQDQFHQLRLVCPLRLLCPLGRRGPRGIPDSDGHFLRQFQ
eukprot:Skav208541  [mRNA]  locus=scaffold1216:321626:322794:+ [translate_table: standard]